MATSTAPKTALRQSAVTLVPIWRNAPSLSNLTLRASAAACPPRGEFGASSCDIASCVMVKFLSIHNRVIYAYALISGKPQG